MEVSHGLPPESPPLAALRTNRSDLALLDESDDLLSPSILGSAAAQRVRSALSPAKARPFDRQRFALDALPETAGEDRGTNERQSIQNAVTESPLPAPQQPQQIASPPSSPDAPAAAMTMRALPRSPLQASMVAGRHVDTEVRRSPGLLDSCELSELCTPPRALPAPDATPCSTGSRSTVPRRRVSGRHTPNTVPQRRSSLSRQAPHVTAAGGRMSPAEASSLRASTIAGAHFDAETRCSPGFLTDAELAGLGTPPQTAPTASSEERQRTPCSHGRSGNALQRSPAVPQQRGAASNRAEAGRIPAAQQRPNPMASRQPSRPLTPPPRRAPRTEQALLRDATQRVANSAASNRQTPAPQLPVRSPPSAQLTAKGQPSSGAGAPPVRPAPAATATVGGASAGAGPRTPHPGRAPASSPSRPRSRSSSRGPPAPARRRAPPAASAATAAATAARGAAVPRQGSRIPMLSSAAPGGMIRSRPAAAAAASSAAPVRPVTGKSVAARAPRSSLQPPGGCSASSASRQPGSKPAGSSARPAPAVRSRPVQAAGPTAAAAPAARPQAVPASLGARAAATAAAAAARPTGRGASRIPAPALPLRGRVRPQQLQLPPEPAPSPEVPASQPISPATLEALMADAAMANPFQPKKQLLAVTPDSRPMGGAAGKRKTAEQRQWEAWASPPDALH